MFKQQPNMTFLLGAGRSGSTLLYKLLSLHPKVGYISSYNNSLPSFLSTGYLNRLLAKRMHLKRKVWFEKSGNAHGFQRNILKRLIPWPVEGENIYARAGIPLFEEQVGKLDERAAACFRKRMLELARQQGVHSMLSKRVANNRRVPWLRAAFPEAKFIHLVRDGREVAHSFTQVSWWHEDTPIWWAGKTMREIVEQDGWDMLSVTARTWVEAVQGVEEGLKGVSEQQVLRVRYEQILENPKCVLQEILTFLQIENCESYFEQVNSLNLHPTVTKWKKAWDTDDYSKVLTQQQEMLSSLGYK